MDSLVHSDFEVVRKTQLQQSEISMLGRVCICRLLVRLCGAYFLHVQNIDFGRIGVLCLGIIQNAANLLERDIGLCYSVDPEDGNARMHFTPRIQFRTFFIQARRTNFLRIYVYVRLCEFHALPSCLCIPSSSPSVIRCISLCVYSSPRIRQAVR